MTFPPRVQPPRTADVQLTPALLAQAARTVRMVVQRAEEVLSEGLEGEGRRRDVADIEAATHGHQRAAWLRLYDMGCEAAELAQASGLDHLLSLPTDFTREPQPTLSHLTLVRVALEAGGMFGYLTDRDAGVRMVLARIAGIKIADNDSAMRLAEAHSDGRMVAGQQQAQAAFSTLLNDAGVTVDRNRRGRLIRTALDGHETQGDISIAAAARDFFGPDEHGAYNLLSGGAHSRPWLLNGNQATEPRSGSVLFVLWVVRDLLAAWLEHWSAYTGKDSQAIVTRIRQDVTITLQRAAEGNFNDGSGRRTS